MDVATTPGGLIPLSSDRRERGLQLQALQSCCWLSGQPSFNPEPQDRNGGLSSSKHRDKYGNYADKNIPVRDELQEDVNIWLKGIELT